MGIASEKLISREISMANQIFSMQRLSLHLYTEDWLLQTPHTTQFVHIRRPLELTLSESTASFDVDCKYYYKCTFQFKLQLAFISLIQK